MAGLRSKHLLRRLAERRLPTGLSGRRKRGFTAPVGEWIGGPYAGLYREEVLGADARLSSIVDVAQLGRLFDEHCAGTHDHSYVLWAAWVFERWLTENMRKPMRPVIEIAEAV
jgi:asparagine synthase (glutamine-hydrolysing)